MTMHKDTIGAIEFEGKTYEIDWPHQLDSETEREDFGVIYLNGEQVADFVAPPGSTLNNAEDVMETARDFMQSGGINE